MKKAQVKALTLDRETLLALSDREAAQVAGGLNTKICTVSCPRTAC